MSYFSVYHLSMSNNTWDLMTSTGDFTVVLEVTKISTTILPRSFAPPPLFIKEIKQMLDSYNSLFFT